MFDLAYFLVRAGEGPILWIVNIVILLIIAVILWMIIKWAAAEFGVPGQIVKIVGLLLFLLLVLSLFVGCTVKFGADGSREVSFQPTVQDYKAIKNISNR